MCIQRKFVQFHNIKFKMPKSQFLIRLATSFKKLRYISERQHLIPSKSGVTPSTPSVQLVQHY